MVLKKKTDTYCTAVLSSMDSTDPLLCIFICRPSKTNKDFIKDCSDLLSSVTVQHDQILMGDFNIPICFANSSIVTELNNVLDSFVFIQHVKGPIWAYNGSGFNTWS